jgi:hypothetical protein
MSSSDSYSSDSSDYDSDDDDDIEEIRSRRKKAQKIKQQLNRMRQSQKSQASKLERRKTIKKRAKQFACLPPRLIEGVARELRQALTKLDNKIVKETKIGDFPLECAEFAHKGLGQPTIQAVNTALKSLENLARFTRGEATIRGGTRKRKRSRHKRSRTKCKRSRHKRIRHKHSRAGTKTKRSVRSTRRHH